MSRHSIRVFLGAVLVTALLSLSSCAWSVGGGKKTSAHTNPTLGKELQDLKAACEEGAITKEEYELAKQRLIDSANQRGG